MKLKDYVGGVIKEVMKDPNTSESEFKKEGGQYDLLLNEYLMGERIGYHHNIMRPWNFEEHA